MKKLFKFSLNTVTTKSPLCVRGFLLSPSNPPILQEEEIAYR